MSYERYTGWRLAVPWVLAVIFVLGCYWLILSAVAEQEMLQRCVTVPYEPQDRKAECYVVKP